MIVVDKDVVPGCVCSCGGSCEGLAVAAGVIAVTLTFSGLDLTAPCFRLPCRRLLRRDSLLGEPRVNALLAFLLEVGFF